jgi:hypothetical protein
MALKLLALDVCPRLILWILSFLVNRSQSVSTVLFLPLALLLLVLRKAQFSPLFSSHSILTTVKVLISPH